MKSLKPRLLTAIFGITLIIIVMILGNKFPPIISIIIGIISSFMVYEYLNANKLFNQYALSIPCILFAFVLSFCISTKFLFLYVVAFFITVFALMISNYKVISYYDLAYAVFGTLLISFGVGSLSALCATGIGIPLYIVTALAIPWMTDAGGFFIGAAFGKRKLCPNISPKKTVEGALGGVGFCIISAFIIWLIFDFIVMPAEKISILSLLIFAVLAAPISILGDLVFSLIKRSLKIKDYGSIFPGHGGMLDRFDSIIFTAPVLLVVNQFLPLITIQ